MTTILEHWMRHRKFGGCKWYYLFGHYSGNLIEQVALPSFTASDTGQNTVHATECQGSLAPFPHGVYYAEGKYGGTYQDDISRWVNATKTYVANVADFGTVRYNGASASSSHKFWQAGGWNDATNYDDVAGMPFATETCSVATSGMMSSAIYNNRMSSSKMKILHKLPPTNTMEAWPHATETYADIGDSTCSFGEAITMVSDICWYFENYYASSGGNKVSLATETAAAYSDVDSHNANGDGSAGTIAVWAGSYVGGSMTTAIYSFSFATDTWMDTTQDLTSGSIYFQTRGTG